MEFYDFPSQLTSIFFTGARYTANQSGFINLGMTLLDWLGSTMINHENSRTVRCLMHHSYTEGHGMSLLQMSRSLSQF